MRTDTIRTLADTLATDCGAGCNQSAGNASTRSPRFDAAKVAAVRLSILNGTFRIDAAAIADRMIQNGDASSFQLD